MQFRKNLVAGGTLAVVAASMGAIALAVIGCASFTSTGTTVANPNKVLVPVSITDAPGDQVLAASLTLNSVVLTDSTGATASLLTSPLTFEAAHLDAVQEPLFVPSVPEDTYVKVTLTYSDAQVAYIDPATKQLAVATATLANTSQTITFTNPITVSSSSTSLLIDFLVAKSIAISGSTVTVTPAFKVAATHRSPHPGNGLDGLQCGIHGKVSALGTNQFTLLKPEGSSVVINVDSSTKYEGLTGFSALAVGDLLEVDTETQTDGSLLAKRVELDDDAKEADTMLVGPITAVTGSPATSFTQVVRQQIGSGSTLPIATDTITIDSSTTFHMPGRFDDVSGGDALFSAVFSASTLFPGENVRVVTSGVSNNAATAKRISPAPQTIAGTVANIASSNGATVYTVTLASDSWLAILSGMSTVTVYTNGNVQEINSKSFAVGDSARFNGFLFKVNGALVMLADVKADGPGHAFGN